MEHAGHNVVVVGSGIEPASGAVAMEVPAWRLKLDLGHSRAEIFEWFPHFRRSGKSEHDLPVCLWLRALCTKRDCMTACPIRLVQFATKTVLVGACFHQLEGDREFVRFIDAREDWMSVSGE